KLRYRHVERVVARAALRSLGFSEMIPGESIVVAVAATHFDVGRGSAHQCGDAACLVGVLRESSQEGELTAYVRIDKAWENKFAAGVNNLSVGRSFEVLANAGDGFIFRVDVGARARPRRNDFPVADQQSHEMSLR